MMMKRLSILRLRSHHGGHVIITCDKLDVTILETYRQHTESRHGRFWLRQTRDIISLLHVELLTVPLQVHNGHVGGEGDLVDNVPVYIHDNNSTLSCGYIDLLVIWCPGSACDPGVRW